uniref:PRKR-interacting protein 1 n=1 Tax=Glossina brevipalpis TaxID=37001 RepID=A0A1A9WHX3_9MUSC
MALIKNLIKDTDVCKLEEHEEIENEKTRHVVKSALDLQRLKIEKLMQTPNKPVVIPEQRKEKDFMQSVPTFVRNVMGSSAGAGSGEFHVYRHLRRKEYARQKMIQAKSVKEQLDEEYQRKLQENRKEAEEKTAKKRAKRLKKNAKKSRSQKSQREKDLEQDAEET